MTASAASDGAFRLDAVPGACEVRASRQDGWYTVTSAPVAVTPRAGELREVELALPEALQSGLGAEIEPVPEGMRVLAIRRGGGGAEAGVRPGDVVVSVDGAPAGASVEAFAERTRGDVDTTMTLEVLRDGEIVEVTVTRVFLGPARDDDWIR